MSAGSETYLFLAILAGGAVTYFWRGLGVYAAQALDPDGERLNA